MQSFGAKAVLIKGGHFPILDCGFWILDLKTKNRKTKTENRLARDFLFVGDEKYIFEAEFIETTATHGTGCTLAAAIAANLVLGKSLTEAVETAKKFVTEAIRTAPNLGHGHSPVNHSIAGFKI